MKFFFCIFCILIPLSSFLAEFHWQGFWSWTPFARGSFGRRTFGVRFFFVFSNFFGFERKTFELLTTTVPQCCQNCTLCARGTNWEKNNFESKKKYRRWQFSDFNAKCFGVSVGLSISFVRFSFYVSKQIFWIKIHLFNSFF